MWRAFIHISKVINAFCGRPSHLKLKQAVAMKWYYSIGTVDVAHRLKMTATLPAGCRLLFQQMLAFKFFTLAIVNCYSFWMLHINCSGLLLRLQNTRSGYISPFQMRQPAKVLLMREPYHLITQRVSSKLLQIAGPGDEFPTTEVGARSPERSRSHTSQKKRSLHSANKPGACPQRLDSSLRYNEVMTKKGRWCAVCSRCVLKD